MYAKDVKPADQYENDFLSVIAKNAHPVHLENTSTPEPEPATIDLRCPAFRKLFPRLSAWIIITGNYGKPADDTIDDFLLNFGGFLKRRSFVFPDGSDAQFDAVFLNKEFNFTGGFAFFSDVSFFAAQYHGKNRIIAIREFIKSWQPAT